MTTKLFLGDHNIRVSLSKTSALNTVSRPCYEGNDYGDQEYHKLVQLVKEGFTEHPLHILAMVVCRRGLAVCPPSYLGNTEMVLVFAEIRPRQQFCICF